MSELNTLANQDAEMNLLKEEDKMILREEKQPKTKKRSSLSVFQKVHNQQRLSQSKELRLSNSNINHMKRYIK